MTLSDNLDKLDKGPEFKYSGPGMTAPQVWGKLCPQCVWNDGGADGLVAPACLWGNPEYRRAAFAACPLLTATDDR